MFTRDEMTYFAKDHDIQLIRSTPFYAQANRHAEVSNKVLISILEKMLEDNLITTQKVLFYTFNTMFLALFV